MFKITIIEVGKMKKGPLFEQSKEYVKRLKNYIQLHEHSIKEEPFKNASQKNNVTEIETIRIRKKWNLDSVKIVLSEHGKTMTSIEFAEGLSNWTQNGQKEITFVIAGPLGVNKKLLQEADQVLSLSPMTFPHELAHVLLLEQLYRAGTILNNKTYHY
jgi:23S rRNA (pseudouridine1915-N3)-methyltransferase